MYYQRDFLASKHKIILMGWHAVKKQLINYLGTCLSVTVLYGLGHESPTIGIIQI